MKNKVKYNPIDTYAPEGKGDCEMKCDRKVIMTKNGSIIVCDGCKRVVIDNRINNERS